MDPRLLVKGNKTPFKPKFMGYLATAAVANAAADQTKVHDTHAATHALEDESGCQPLADNSDLNATVANIDNFDDVGNSLLFTVNNSPTGISQPGDSSDTLSGPDDQTFVNQTFVNQTFFGTFDHSLDHTLPDHAAVDQSFVHPLTFTDTTDTYKLAATIISIIGERAPSMESDAPSVGQDRDAVKPSHKPSPKGLNEASAFISQLMVS